MTNITGQHRHAFQALRCGSHDNCALFSCHVTGSPTAAIVTVKECPLAKDDGETEYEITPIFVSITDEMVLTDHDGRGARWPRRRAAYMTSPSRPSAAT